MKEITVPVLDKGFVTLIDHLGGDLTVANSARVSYGKKKDELDEKDVKLIHFLVREKHDSPLRHVQIQFRVKAPEFVMRQWYKHVVGVSYTVAREPDHAWNEISGRYVQYNHEFYRPQSFRKQSENKSSL
jgi:thymidylate synthase (FAD)